MYNGGIIMSKLGDFLKGRKSEPAPVVEKKEDKEIRRYNRIWLKKITDTTGYIVSDNDKKVDGILSALNRKNGHCPCGGSGNQFLCPCVNMREHGICKCGLFENVRPVNPSGSSNGRIK